jgi:hypothetical protein
MNNLRIERRQRRPEATNGLSAVVWLGKMQAGAVGYFDLDSDGNDRYVPTCFLPEVKAGINKGTHPDDFDSLEEALMWLVGKVESWIEKAGFDAAQSELDQAHLANIKPLDGATRDEWLRLAAWAEEIDSGKRVDTFESNGFANQVAKVLPVIVQRAIDCGFTE